jgi:Rrf2 family protein
MIDLALHNDGQYVPVRDISLRQKVSVKYIEQIITLLSRAGYLKSVRGNRGGYMLSRPPKDYTVGMVLRCAEGSLTPVACLDDDINLCPHSAVCPTLPLWRRLNDAINGVVDNMTIQDLIDEYPQAEVTDSENYMI